MSEDARERGWPARQGEAWTEDEYEQMVQYMAAGVSVSEIAARLQRTVRGIDAQIRNLIPEDAEVGRPVTQGREEWLRQKLAVNPATTGEKSCDRGPTMILGACGPNPKTSSCERAGTGPHRCDSLRHACAFPRR